MKKFLLIKFILLHLSLSSQVLPTLNFTTIKSEAVIDTLSIEVNIWDNIAETTIDITFYNPNESIMEGTLEVPLNNSQSITEFHLEVNGKLRKASIVEKEKGRVAYEATVRENIDPGLLELNRGNVFKARVFPIPGNGFKRARIKILDHLNFSNGNYIYKLPTKSGYTVPNFSLKVKNYGDKSPIASNDLEFVKWNNISLLELSQKNYKFGKEIKFQIPETNTKVWLNNSYFYTSIEVSDLFVVKEKRISEYKKLTVLWDISASFKNRDLELEYSYLKKYLSGINSKSDVLIKPFNITTYSGKSFKAGEWNKILSYLDMLNYDGGTSLEKLNFNYKDTEEILLFTDGITTFDNLTEPSLSNIPITTISSSYRVNRSLLRYYSIKTGGDYIDLLNSGELKNRPKLIRFEASGIDKVFTDLEIDNNRFSVSGRLLDRRGYVKLIFRKSDGIEVTRKIDINEVSNDTMDTERLWAIKKIQELNLLYEKNRESIQELGKKHGIVTRNTSLIVLDRVEDYARFNIEPPKELRQRWEELVRLSREDKAREEVSKISQAVSDMIALKDWWNRDFPREPPPVINKAKSMEVLESREEAPITLSRSEDEYEAGLERKEKSIGSSEKEAIVVEGWTPDEPYINEIKNLNGDALVDKYYELSKIYKNRPSFFIDMASQLHSAGNEFMALMAISNVMEMGIDEPELIRITLYLLEKFGYFKEALDISYKLLDIRGEEPQTYRDIGNLALLNGLYQEALNNYYIVLEGRWDSRFNGIKSVVLNELNFLISRYRKELDLGGIDKRLIYPMPLGVRAVISWSSDNNDIDLWVKDPYGEDCGYSNSLTYTGGKLSADFTGGYGPEEFSIKEPLTGDYFVEINFFSDNRVSVSGPVTIKVDLYKNYGKKVTKKTIIRRLTDVKERITIGRINFD